VIVDSHTHAFPSEFVADRERLIGREPAFAEMYADPKARMATVDDLVGSMKAARIDVSVALGFAWRDPRTCRAHNDYLLAAAAETGGQVVPFCNVAGSTAEVRAEALRCLERGARGFGELRPEDQELGLEAGGPLDALADIASEAGVPVLFHVSEPVGHAYPGRAGGLSVAGLVQFVGRWPGLQVIAAHWGGGLPFYALMPEVAEAVSNVTFDTAASSLLYDERVYRVAVGLVGAHRIVFGSDYPLLSQKRSLERVRTASLPEDETRAVLGENARRLLGL
jgi:predicted TIM-barrel fold metal-dependent hydrolase